jgi:hypothetical protein
MIAATVIPMAYQNAPGKALVAPWTSGDWSATATIAVPNEAPTCCAMRVFCRFTMLLPRRTRRPVYDAAQGMGR